MFRPILLTLTTAATLAAGSMIAHGRDSVDAPGASAGATTAHSPLVSRERVSDAIATAVISSISRQFDTNDVTVKFDSVDVAPASVQDREVAGAGRLRLAGDPQWIPFRFAALYDTESTEVTHPRLHLGDDDVAGGSNAALGRSLESRVAAELKSEFAGQAVTWTLGETSVAAHGARFVHVVGTGVADFGLEGSVRTAVQGLYDREAGRWLRVNYELGAGEEWAEAGEAVATL